MTNKRYSNFKFWLASKFILLALAIIDKDSFEGISLAFALREWTNQLINRIHNDNTPEEFTKMIDNIAKTKIKEKNNENKIDTH